MCGGHHASEPTTSMRFGPGNQDGLTRKAGRQVRSGQEGGSEKAQSTVKLKDARIGLDGAE